MQAIGGQPNPAIRAPDGAPVHYECHQLEQTTLYRPVQQHAATFFAQAKAAAGADLPQFVRKEFDPFLECGILAHGVLRLRCGDCGHDKPVAFSCKHRGSEEQGQNYMADDDGDSGDARTLRPLQAAACTYLIAFGPRAG